MKNQVIKSSFVYHSKHSWLESRHIFSFSNYYDPNNMWFWNMRVFNDDYIDAKSWFWMHPHDNMEILTIMIEGEITHSDNIWNTETIKKWYIHWNLHQSNFFVKDWKIWIFDFVNYSKWNNEKDISRVIFWLWFNTDIIINFLNIYWFNNINFELLLKEMIILYWLEKKDVKFDFVWFKKTIQLIKWLY